MVAVKGPRGGVWVIGPVMTLGAAVACAVPLSFHGIDCGSVLRPKAINNVTLRQDFPDVAPGVDDFNGFPGALIQEGCLRRTFGVGLVAVPVGGCGLVITLVLRKVRAG